MPVEIAGGLVTQCLWRASAGDQTARDQAYQFFEKQLRRLAAERLRGEDAGVPLQVSCLVNDAFLKLMNSPHGRWSDRHQFLRYAAEAMRQILVDHARQRKAQKRGNGVRPLSLSDGPEPLDSGRSPSDLLENHEQVLAIDRALSLLADSDRDSATVVILNFFGDYSLTEIAQLLEVSLATVKSRLARAKTLLSRMLRRNPFLDESAKCR
ncbi:MAG: ECF-type sigma factor [Planctomycetaceae bacterium]